MDLEQSIAGKLSAVDWLALLMVFGAGCVVLFGLSAALSWIALR